jgi:adenylate cyclase
VRSKAFFDLMRRRTPQNAAAIDRRVERESLSELTVLMSDSSGFSRKTREFGIIQFLAVMTHCYDRLIPLLESHKGVCLANSADNLLAVFDDPNDAVGASIAMHRWLARRNEGLHERDRFNVCIGLHHGKLLRFKDNVYGNTVNIAAKLGEDVASKDEILVTDPVKEKLSRKYKLKFAKSADIGGRTFDLHKVLY